LGKEMEELRTLAKALAAGAHGGSASSGGFSCNGRLRSYADRNDIELGEPHIDLQMRRMFGHIVEWAVQRLYLTKAAIIEAEDPGDSFLLSLAGASLDRGQVTPPFAMNAMKTKSDYRLLTEQEDPRGVGMAFWLWFSYVFFHKYRTKSLCFFPYRIYADDKTCSKADRAPLPPGDYGDRADLENFQIFINMPTGNSILVWVNDLVSVEELRAIIARRMGYHACDFYLVHAGKSMEVSLKLSDYQISRNSSISLLLRLRGGAEGKQRGSIPTHKGAGPSSYKDAARQKGPQTEAPSNVLPSPYIVEKLESTPVLEIKNDQVKGLFKSLQAKAVICRFNGFWPKSHDLHCWIFQNWTANCQILLCTKGFFIVQFESLEEYQKVLLQGPWFWGRAGLFITPWFPEFDANTMVVTKMPVWVRLPNLPLPYWHHLVLEDIGNLLGSFIKSDKERQDKGLFTYARICVEIDLSKGLPDRIHLKHESFIWLQRLDYENTAFRCRFCHLTGHLQDTCPLAKKFPKKKKGPRTNRKNWQADFGPTSDEEEGSEAEEQQDMKRTEEPMVSDATKEQSTGNQTHGEDTQTNVENPKVAVASSQKHMEDSIPGEGPQTAIVIHEEAPISGVKRGHESEKSDSDKEQPSKQKPEMVNGRQVVIATTSQGRWVEVKSKRKGKKGKIEAYYQP